MTILNQIVVIMLNITLWSGRKKLRPEDLAANGVELDKLPPGTLASLGTKRIIAPEALNPFSALKKEAERVCLTRGVRFLGGFAIPRDDVQGVIAELKKVKERFASEKDKLLSDYDHKICQWITENPPEWAPVIRAAIEPIGTIDEAMNFNFAPVAVSSPEGLEEENHGLETEAAGLLGQLYHEIRLQAKSAYEATFVGRNQVNRKALRPIAAMREKLQGLSFLDPEIVEAIQSIEECLSRIPKNGPINGASLDMLAGLVGRRLANIGKAFVPDDPQPVEEEVEDEILEIQMTAMPVFPQTITPIAFDF